VSFLVHSKHGRDARATGFSARRFFAVSRFIRPGDDDAGGDLLRNQKPTLFHARPCSTLPVLQWALREGVSVWRVSFIDAMRYLQARLLGLDGIAELLMVPYRPGRWEPRARRRRMKEFDLLNVPRSVSKLQEKQGENA